MSPRLFLYLLAALPLLAAENDDGLPKPFDPGQLEAVLGASPFNRAINPSDTLVLTGMAHVNGKTLVHLLDTETKKTHVVTDKPNKEGWVLETTLPTRDFARARVTIRMGGEVVTIRSNAAAVAESRKAASGSAQSSDRGPRDSRGPSEGDRGYSKGQRGPSKEDIARFQAMSPEGQEKMKNFFRENRDKFMGMNEDDRRNFIRSNAEKIINEDQQRKGGGGKPPR
jgi:hypothetical protein